MDPTQIPPLPPSHQAPAGHKPLRVHVIEGDAAFARDVARALEARGMVARAIVGGQAGIDEVQLDPPDLIVLCADLPDVSGYTVCSRLKRTRESGGIPIILTSARPDTSAFQSHQKLWVRADAYLRKPFDVAALAALLQKLAPLVAERRAAAAAACAAPDDGDVLEDGFEYLGDGDAATETSDGAAHEAPPPMPAAAAGDEVFDDGVVRVVVEPPVPAVALGGAVLEDKDVRIELPVGAPTAAAAVASRPSAPAPAPAVARSIPPPVPRAPARAPAAALGREAVAGGEELLDRHGVARASRMAPGRWKLPAGFGAAA